MTPLVSHVMSSVARLAASDARPDGITGVERRWGRYCLDLGEGLHADVLHVVTGTSTIRFRDPSGTSFLMIHNLSPLGVEAIRTLISSEPVPRLAGVLEAFGPLPLPAPALGRRTWQRSDGSQRGAIDSARQALVAASGAVAAARTRCASVDAILSWPDGQPAISLACDDDQGPVAPGPAAVAAVAAIPPLDLLAEVSCWQSVAGLMGEPAPSFGTDLGLMLTSEVEVRIGTEGPLERLRAIAAGVDAADRLGHPLETFATA